MGPTRQGARPGGGRASLARGFLGTPLRYLFLLVFLIFSIKNYGESFIPFGLRLIFLSEKGQNLIKEFGVEEYGQPLFIPNAN